MKDNNFFKFLFWFITLIFGALFGVLAVRMGTLISGDPDFPPLMLIFFIFMFLLLFAAVAAIAIFVYRDAPKRGMNRWLWMLLAVYLPNFIGLIIYVIVRSSNKNRCINCGKDVKSDYELCPYCGKPLNSKCTQCGKNVSADWIVCPYCKTDLNG